MRVSSLFLFFIYLIVASCDVVEDPFSESRPQIDLEFGNPVFNDTFYSDTTILHRKVILEEFTGHKCPNCPRGAELAKAVQSDYPNNMIIVALHNSVNFSKPDPEKGFPSDFETTTGENLRLKYNLISFPSGMIDRLPIGLNNSRAVSWANWQNELTKVLNDPNYLKPKFKIDLKVIVNSENRLLRIFPKVQALENLQGEYFLSHYLLENKIIAPQEDARRNPARIPDYEHNNLLRAGFMNNEIGTKIFENPTANELFMNDSLASGSISINQSWVLENLQIVSFVHEISSGEIFQAQTLDLK